MLSDLQAGFDTVCHLHCYRFLRAAHHSVLSPYADGTLMNDIQPELYTISDGLRKVVAHVRYSKMCISQILARFGRRWLSVSCLLSAGTTLLLLIFPILQIQCDIMYLYRISVLLISFK